VGAPLAQGHVARGHGVLGHHGARLRAGVKQGPVGVIDDQLLAEDVDVLPRTARKADAVGRRRGELDRIADLIAPQAVDRGDEHRVDPAALDPLEGYDALSVAEFVEGPVVEHQQHVVARRVVGQGEEALRGVVGLHVDEVVRGQQLAERLPVGRELHTAVGEHLELRPHLKQVLPPGILEHAAHQRQVPRRNAGKGRNRLADALAADGLALGVEIGDDGRLDARGAEPAAPEGRLVDQQRREVADQVAPLLRAGAPQRQGLALEGPRLRVRRRIERRHVAHAQRVVPPERVARHGDVLAAVGGGARRAGEERHAPGRSHAADPFEHPLDVGFERIVVEGLDLRLELLHGMDVAQVVAVAELGHPPPAQQVAEHALLRLDRMTAEAVDGPCPAREPRLENRISERHRIVSLCEPARRTQPAPSWSPAKVGDPGMNCQLK
jgi:hypothetical protein